jgi:hypothetical protein
MGQLYLPTHVDEVSTPPAGVAGHCCAGQGRLRDDHPPSVVAREEAVAVRAPALSPAQVPAPVVASVAMAHIGDGSCPRCAAGPSPLRYAEVRLAPAHEENARPPGPPDMSTTGQGSGSHVYVSGENEPAKHDSVASLGVKPDRHWVVQLSLWRIEKLSEQGPLPATSTLAMPL